MKNFLILSFLWGLLFYVRVSSGQQQAVANAAAGASAGDYGNYGWQGIGPNGGNYMNYGGGGIPNVGGGGFGNGNDGLGGIGVPQFQTGPAQGYNPYNGGYNFANAESSAVSSANAGGGQWQSGGGQNQWLQGGGQNQWLQGGGPNNGALNQNNGGSWGGGGPNQGSGSNADARAIAAASSGGNTWGGGGPNQGSGSNADAAAIAAASSGGNTWGGGGPNQGSGTNADAAAIAAASSGGNTWGGGGGPNRILRKVKKPKQGKKLPSGGSGGANAFSESDAQALSEGSGSGSSSAIAASNAQAQSDDSGNAYADAQSLAIAQSNSDGGAPLPPGGGRPYNNNQGNNNQGGGNNYDQWRQGGSPGGPLGRGNNPGNRGNAYADAQSLAIAQSNSGSPSGPPGGGNNPGNRGNAYADAQSLAIAQSNSGSPGGPPGGLNIPKIGGGSPGVFNWPAKVGGGGDNGLGSILQGLKNFGGDQGNPLSFGGDNGLGSFLQSFGGDQGNPLGLGGTPFANFLPGLDFIGGDGSLDWFNKWSSILDACNSGNWDDAVAQLDQLCGGSGTLIDLWSKWQDKIPPTDQWTDVSAWCDKWGIDPTLYPKLQNFDWNKLTDGFKSLPGKAMSYLLRYWAYKGWVDLPSFLNGMNTGYLCGINFPPIGQWSGVPGNYWQKILSYCLQVDPTPPLTDPTQDMTAEMLSWACKTFNMDPAVATNILMNWKAKLSGLGLKEEQKNFMSTLSSFVTDPYDVLYTD